MLQADPALLVQLHAQTELAGAAAVITKAAAAQGLDVSETDLMSHMTAEQSQAGAAAMSDAELAHVAGGFLTMTIAFSIASVGLMCAAMSIINAIEHKNSRGNKFGCKEALAMKDEL